MSNIQQSLETLVIECRAIYALLVDSGSGMILGQAIAGANHLDTELLAAGTTEIVRADKNTMRLQNIESSDEILFTQERHFHIIHITVNYPGLYIVMGMEKEQGNLALARLKINDLDKQLQL